MNVVRMRSSKGNATNDISTVALAVLVGLASVPFQKIFISPREISHALTSLRESNDINRSMLLESLHRYNTSNVPASRTRVITRALTQYSASRNYCDFRIMAC